MENENANINEEQNDVNSNLDSGEQQQEQAQSQSQSQTIQLSIEDYQELMAAAAMAQAMIQGQENNKQQKPAQQPSIDPADIDRMSNRQLMALMQQEVVGPLMQNIMNMAVKEELREVQSEFSDFNDYRNDTLTIAQRNTSLTLREAYLLAKSNKSQNKKSEPIPLKPKQLPTPAQRTTQALSTTEPTGGLTLRESAQKALEAIKYKE